MSDEDSSFLRRWSLRKRDTEDQARQKQQQETAPEESAQTDRPEAEEDEALQAQEEQLPDPETLGRDADWSAYLKKGVPEGLRRRALQRLWRLDPVYSNRDGLVDYDEDFNDPVLLSRKVKTLFQVGKGMVLPESEETELAAADDEPSQMPTTEPSGAAGAPTLPEAESSAAPTGSGGFPEEAESRKTNAQSSRSRKIASQASEEEALPAKSRDSALKRRWGQS